VGSRSHAVELLKIWQMEVRMIFNGLTTEKRYGDRRFIGMDYKAATKNNSCENEQAY
jgi:hypothetical protein